MSTYTRRVAYFLFVHHLVWHGAFVKSFFISVGSSLRRDIDGI